MTINRSAILLFLAELRRSARLLLFSLVGLTFALFLTAGWLRPALQRHIGGELYFFSVAEPFLAHVKLAFFAALFCLMPLILGILWRALAAPFGMEARQRRGFVWATVLLFYAGAVFCWFVTLPFGIRFLLGFGGETLTPTISVSRFVNFVSLFVLAFGLIFQLPVFMIFSVKVRLASRAFFERRRRYAVLIIAVLAAVLTPTPDVVNMGLMGLPLYALYETGILLIRRFGLEAGAGETGKEPEADGQ